MKVFLMRLSVAAAVAACLVVVARASMEGLDEQASIGEDYMKKGQYQAAVKVYEKIMAFPSYENILTIKFELAWAYYLTGAFEKAIPLFTDLSGVRAPSKEIEAQALATMADCYARMAAGQEEKNPERKKNIQKALDLHDKFQGEFPKNPSIPQSLYGRGFAYFLNKQYDKAEADLNALIREHPKTSAAQDAYYLLATVFSQQGLEKIQAGKKEDARPLLDKARHIYDQLSKIEGNLVTANDSAFALAETWYGAKIYTEAIRAYREVRAKNEVLQNLRSRESNARAQMSAAIARREDTTAIKRELDMIMGQIITVSDSSDLMIASYLRIAQSYFEMGWYNVCRVVCRHLMEQAQAPTDRKQQAHFMLVSCYVKENDVVSAAREFEALQQTFGSAIEGADMLGVAIGQLLLRRGTEEDTRLALTMFAKNVEDYPQSKSAEDALYMKFSTEYLLEQHAVAAASIAVYLEKYPKGRYLPNALYYKAMCLMALGNLEEALQIVNTVIDQYPKKTETFEAQDEVFYQKGAMLVQMKKSDEAIKHFKLFPERFPESPLRPQVLFQLGVAYNAAEQLDQAKAALEEVAVLFPEHEIAPLALYQIGVFFYERKDYSRMAAALEHLVQTFPNCAQVADAYFWMGWIAQQDNQYDEAVANFTLCVEANPHYANAAECLFSIAQCHKDKAAKMGLPTVLSEARRAEYRAIMMDAAIAYEDLLINYPDSDRAQEAIPGIAGMIFELVRYKQMTEQTAERFFTDMIERHAGKSDLQAQLSFGYGNYLMRNSQTEKALAAFKQAFALSPDVRLAPSLLASYAEALANVGELIEAEAIYRKLIAENSENPRALAPAWFGVAEIKYLQKTSEGDKEAEMLYKQVLQDFPWYERGKQGRVKLAAILERNGNYAEAERMFGEVWRQEKGEARIGAMLGVARCQLAQVQSRNRPDNWQDLLKVCSENLTKIIVLYEAFPEYVSEAYWLQGQTCEANKDIEKAKEMYYQVVSRFNNYPSAKPAAERLRILGGYTPPVAPAAK